MKAVLKKSLDSGIIVEEVPIPVIGDSEVLLKVRAAGICGSDVHMYEGSSSYKVFEEYFPLILGHEFCGDVAEVGKNVTVVKPGDRAVSRVAVACGDCYYCRSGRMHLCPEAGQKAVGLRKNGGFAEYVAVNESALIPMPDLVSYEMGALVEPLGITANAVFDSGLEMGETVVVQGPGPIGLFTLMLAKARGAGKAIMIGTSKDKLRLELARQFDADHIIIADETDSVQAVMELTGGHGANVVFEASGAPQLIQNALNMADKCGRVVVEGIYGAPAQVDFTPFVRGAKRLIGTYGGPIAWERMLDWLGSRSYYATLPGKVITHRSRLEDAEAAFERSVNQESVKEMFITD